MLNILVFRQRFFNPYFKGAKNRYNTMVHLLHNALPVKKLVELA
jgi:hypothetical protein